MTRQIKNLGYVPESYFSLPAPQFNGNVVLMEIDDGQFRKISYLDQTIYLDLKLPQQDKWKWVKAIPIKPYERLKKILDRGKILSPLIRKVQGNGWEKYLLTMRVEVSLPQTQQDVAKVLAVDLGLGTSALAVLGVIENDGKKSSPIYLKAQKIVKKILRLRFTLSRLQSKIANWHQQKAWERIKHLRAHQKGIHNKINRLTKELLEILTKEIVYIALLYGCRKIVIEDLSWVEPQKGQKTLSWLKSRWFTGKFKARLKEKAGLYAIAVVEVSVKDTTSRCCQCHEKVEKTKERLVICPNGHKKDRDFNAVINIGKRALGIPSLYGKGCEVECSISLNSLLPLSTLTAWIKIVKSTFFNHWLAKARDG
ncbi:MAG: transposase [Deltaproteobacteria bacterium]|nr:transposase [Deltaproteobacteria bacterium]